MSEQSLYEVLGVAPTADEATLRRAYVALARQHHPDMSGGDATRMRAVNGAWATLGDPARRATYDSGLAPRSTPPRDAVVDPDAVRVNPDEDLDEEMPVRVTVRLPGWVSMIPVALLGCAVVSFVAGVVMVSPPLIALAAMSLVLCFLFFVAAPFIALFAARTGDRNGESGQ